MLILLLLLAGLLLSVLMLALLVGHVLTLLGSKRRNLHALRALLGYCSLGCHCSPRMKLTDLGVRLGTKPLLELLGRALWSGLVAEAHLWESIALRQATQVIAGLRFDPDIGRAAARNRYARKWLSTG